VHGGGTDEQPFANAARFDLADVQQPTHSTGRYSAKLAGGFFEGPEQRVGQGSYSKKAQPETSAYAYECPAVAT